MNSENLEIIRLVNSRDDDPRALSKSKELMADHLDVEVFLIEQSKFTRDERWLLKLLQELIKNKVSKIVV